MPEFISETTPVARKEHRCDHCGRVINRGVQYSSATMRYDDLYVFKAHLDCAKAGGELYRRLGRPEEGVTLSSDVEREDCEWIADTWPAVAVRLWPTVNIVQVVCRNGLENPMIGL